MRALVVAPEPFFSPRGTPLSVYYRTLMLAEQGVEIDLLTYGQGEDVEIERVRMVRIPAFRLLGPVPVGPSLLKLFLDGFLVIWMLALLVRHRYHFVDAHEESVFFARLLRPLFGYRLVYDMHSSLPQQLTNFRFTRSRLLIRLFDRLERWCLEGADAVITISPAMAEIALARMPSSERHFLIENSLIDEVRLKRPAGGGSSGAEPWEARLPSDAAVIAYAGTFESYQGLDLLIGAFRRVLDARPDAFLLMIGGTPAQVAESRRRAESEGVEGRTLFTGRLPQAEARRLLSRADVLTSPRSVGTNTPLKIYEQLASGRPLVATRILAHTQVLDDGVCFLAEPQPRALAKALLDALGEPERARRLAAAAAELYASRYSRAAYARKIGALLEHLG